MSNNALILQPGMPIMDVSDAGYRRQALVEFTKSIMVKGTDFGVIPGTGDKPTLLKPGAEKLTTFFGLAPRFELIDSEKDWTGNEHGGEAFFYMQYRCELYRADMLIGSGVGSCNSWEKKYRYRTVYPNKATEEDKANGKLETRSGRTGPYQVYVVKNPDPADLVNTIDKMAQKRALVAATLIAVNASEFFTQDVEDMDFSGIIEGDYEPVENPKPRRRQTPPPQTNGKASDLTPPMPDETTFKRYMALGGEVYGDEWDDKRPVQVTWITNQRKPAPEKELTSSKELTLPEIKRLIAIMEDRQESERQPIPGVDELGRTY